MNPRAARAGVWRRPSPNDGQGHFHDHGGLPGLGGCVPAPEPLTRQAPCPGWSSSGPPRSDGRCQEPARVSPCSMIRQGFGRWDSQKPDGSWSRLLMITEDSRCWGLRPKSEIAGQASPAPGRLIPGWTAPAVSGGRQAMIAHHFRGQSTEMMRDQEGGPMIAEGSRCWDTGNPPRSCGTGAAMVIALAGWRAGGQAVAGPGPWRHREFE
jgi:hypothetical protein